MDSKFTKSKTNLKFHPQEKANGLSNLFYCWTVPIFRKGYKKPVSDEDIYPTLNRQEATNLGSKLEKSWKRQIDQNLDPSMWKCLWNVLKWDILGAVFLSFLIDFPITILRPIAFGKLMGYYTSNKEATKDEAIMYASTIIILSLIKTLIENRYMIHVQQIGIKVKVAVSSVIYRKSLRLSKEALDEISVGHIVNLLSNDVQQLVDFFRYCDALWVSPLQAALVIYLLYALSGFTALVGISFIVVMTPIQLFVSKKSAYYRLRIALKTDERIRYMNEIISGIQVIKCYTWEQPFIKLIDSIRRKEMYLIKIANYLDALLNAFSFFVDRSSIFLCVLVLVLTGNSPNAQYVFVVTCFYEILMGSISLSFPHALTQVLQSNVCIKRLENFFKLQEAQNRTSVSKNAGIKVEQANAKWSKNSVNTLTNVNFAAEKSETVAIIGAIGSGKSSFLHLCLGELPPDAGSVQIGGRISYANQEPWLFASTVKQNILFGESFNRKKYSEVVSVCALEGDFAKLPQGDSTIVGERGILLSGGQKARINLARAIYRDADIYLLDDPLSAVDIHVGKQIFFGCIGRYLKDKCVVLVTHQVQYLPYVDKVYVMNKGSIEPCRSYNLENDNNFEAQIGEVNLGSVEEKKDEELSKTSKVSKKVYSSYFNAATSCFGFFFIALFFVLTEVFATGADYYITFWVNLEQKKFSNSSLSYFEKVYLTEQNCAYIYSAIIGSLILCVIVRSMTYIHSCMKASVKLHNRMFSSIVSATMGFFYKNSSGRILNRFAKDISTVDEVLPELLMDAIEITFSIIGTVLAICLVSPWVLIPTGAVFTVMCLMRKFFLRTSVNIKRMESRYRSPVFGHLTESMKGLTTIRALGAYETLEKEFDNYQNVHSSVFYMYLGTNRAFATWLDLLCVFYVAIIAVIALNQETYGGNVGFLLTQGLTLTSTFQYGVRRWSELDNQMTSVERILEYIKVSKEDDKTESAKSQWPSSGQISFNSVSLKYSQDDDYVLKNISVLIQPKEKIGIVGRTGAGKSSLTNVLFRLVDFEGSVLIDNVDTKTVALSSLRSNISIIPQEPILFSGSVRKNLDPFDQHKDEQIWTVLQQVKLKDFVEQLPAGLYSNLSEGGSNFSVGQKQLICLARALLKNNKILVLDEATANVDPETDELLQKTIQTSFKDCTVLTIAHRLHTVMDADKVLVMDNGQVVEFDKPSVLLENKDVFYNLVMETGKEMGENLLAIARKRNSTLD